MPDLVLVLVTCLIEQVPLSVKVDASSYKVKMYRQDDNFYVDKFGIPKNNIAFIGLQTEMDVKRPVCMPNDLRQHYFPEICYIKGKILAKLIMSLRIFINQKFAKSKILPVRIIIYSINFPQEDRELAGLSFACDSALNFFLQSSWSAKSGQYLFYNQSES